MKHWELRKTKSVMIGAICLLVGGCSSGGTVEYIPTQIHGTLWNTVAEHTDNTVDIRRVIYDTKEYNHINDCDFQHEGQKVVIVIRK